MKITLPTILDTVRDLKDRSCKLSFITRELTNEEFNKLRDLRGLEGWLLFSENELKEEDIPEEDAEFEKKTYSKRLRNSLYVLWKQYTDKGKIDIDWETFYKQQMEKAIQKVKNLME